MTWLWKDRGLRKIHLIIYGITRYKGNTISFKKKDIVYVKKVHTPITYHGGPQPWN